MHCSLLVYELLSTLVSEPAKSVLDVHISEGTCDGVEVRTTCSQELEAVPVEEAAVSIEHECGGNEVVLQGEKSLCLVEQLVQTALGQRFIDESLRRYAIYTRCRCQVWLRLLLIFIIGVRLSGVRVLLVV